MFAWLIRISTRYQFIVVGCTLLWICLGIWCFSRLKIEAFPDVTNMQVMVIGLVHGQASEEVERQVTIPLERALLGIAGSIGQRSVTSFGLVQVIVTFQDDVDIHRARHLVGERLAAVRFPEHVSVFLGPNDTPVGQIFRYTLQSQLQSPAELRTLQDYTVEPWLRQIAGVADVIGFGGFQKEVHILGDATELYNKGLTLQEVIDAISRSNVSTSGGFVRQGETEFLVRGEGYLETLDDIRQTVIVSKDGVPVLVRDVATVTEGYTPRRGVIGRNTQDEVVTGVVLLERGANPKFVLEQIHQRIEWIQSSILSDDVIISPFYDRGILVQKTLHTVGKNVTEGALLVVLIVGLMLGAFRGALIVAWMIPIALASSFIGLYCCGLPANLLSMGALDFGILLDGSIVLIEHVYAKLYLRKQGGLSIDKLVVASAIEVIRPAFFSLIIMCTTMLPLLLLDHVEGRIFRPVAMTYIFALLGCCWATLTITPALATIFLRGEQEQSEQRWLQICQHWYIKGIQATLLYRRVSCLVLAGVVVAGTMVFKQIGTEFLPEMNEGDIFVAVTLPSTVALEESQKVMGQLRRNIMLYPEVQDVISELGHPEDGTDDEAPNQGKILIVLRPEQKEFRSRQQLIEVLRSDLQSRPGITYNFSAPIKDRVEESISGVRGQVVLKIFGQDLSVIQNQLLLARNVLQEIDGAADVELYRSGVTSQLVVDIDRSAIARFGLSVDTMTKTIESAFGGIEATQMFVDEVPLTVRVKLPKADRMDVTTVGNLLIASEHTRIPLAMLADIRLQEGRSQISRENLRRFLALKCNVIHRDIGSFVQEAQEKVDQVLQLPQHYRAVWSGEFENQQHSIERLSVVLPFVLLIVFFLLMISLRSFWASLTVCLALPLTVMGGLLSLWLTNTVLSVSAIIGFITLMGVAVMDSVLLLSQLVPLYTASNIDPTFPTKYQIAQACAPRLRPVMMTALLAAMGLLPAALSHEIGSELQQPFAIVILGGLLSSTVLTLLGMPLLLDTVLRLRKFILSYIDSLLGTTQGT